MKCGFIGHCDIMDIEPQIQKYIFKLVKIGVTEFCSCATGNFDFMCEKAVRGTDAMLTYLPYNGNKINGYQYAYYDNIICPFENEQTTKAYIPERNKWMVDYCDVFLCCVYKKDSAYETYNYMLSKNKKYINLAD